VALVGLDFKNPEDPGDKSFEPHPENYPWVVLEYPNCGASEKYVFLSQDFW